MPDLQGGLAFMSSSNRDQWASSFNNFAPRAGIAYRITNNLVARAGYGIFFDRTTLRAR